MSTSTQAPIPNLATIVRYAASKECWNYVLDKHHTLITGEDRSGREADNFYQYALLEWGAYWEHYDLLNVATAIIRLTKLQHVAFLSPIEPETMVSRALGLLLQHSDPLSITLLKQSMVAIRESTHFSHAIATFQTSEELFQSLNTNLKELTLVIYEMKTHRHAAEIIEGALSCVSPNRIVVISGLQRKVDVELLRLRGQQHDADLSLFTFREDAPGIAIIKQGRSHIDG